MALDLGLPVAQAKGLGNDRNGKLKISLMLDHAAVVEQNSTFTEHVKRS